MAIALSEKGVGHSEPKSRMDILLSEMTKAISTLTLIAKERLYNVRPKKGGHKKFVARQPVETKEWRGKMKGLLREYLSLKFSKESEITGEVIPMREDELFLFRFRTKIDGPWYELTNGCNRYNTLSLVGTNIKKVSQLNDRESLVLQRGILAHIFNGACYEEINILKVAKIADDFWSSWKTNKAWDEYQKIIHPALTEAAVEVLQVARKPLPKVVEICGGDGALAEKIAKTYQKYISYYLLEFNEPSLEAARKRFEDTELAGSVTPIKTDVTDGQDFYTDAKKTRVMKAGSIDLIIGSGALNACVFEGRDVAMTVAKKCHELLKPKGKMILAGYSHALLDSDDFLALGFKIHNCSLAGASNEEFSTKIARQVISQEPFNNQFYILEKAS